LDGEEVAFLREGWRKRAPIWSPSIRKHRQYPPFWRDKSTVQYNLGVAEIQPGFWLILPVRAKYIRPDWPGDLDLEKARFR
jgi:hypothetical protein